MKKTLIVSLGLASAVSGCLSMQSQTTMEAIQNATNGTTMNTKPYVEAYVEYRGPHEKWAGPTTFLMHVSAKDAGMARISVTPALFAPPIPNPTMNDRTLASAKGMTGEAARDQMSRLASAMQGGDVAFNGCLYPVRVRLIRADGAIVEKSGCRGSEGWAKATSEAVNQFVVATVGGAGAPIPGPAPAPASN